MKKLIELRQQKTALKNQMRSLLEKADSENRSLTDDEGKQFDELRAKADSLDTDISRLESVADEERSKPGTGIQKLSSDELRNYIVTRVLPLWMNITCTQTTGFIPHLSWGWGRVRRGCYLPSPHRGATLFQPVNNTMTIAVRYWMVKR